MAFLDFVRLTFGSTSVTSGAGSGSGGASGGSSLTGDNNLCVGYGAGYDIEGGCTQSTFIGNYAGYSTTTGGQGNTAIGYQSLYSQTNASSTVTENVGVGIFAGRVFLAYTTFDPLVGCGHTPSPPLTCSWLTFVPLSL